MNKRLRATMAAAAMGSLAACATTAPTTLMQGPPVIAPPTLYADALACIGRSLAGRPHYRIGVSAVTDRTGKFSLEDGGYKVSQGPDLMVISALAESKAVNLVERVDTRVIEWELKYANDKILGDGPRVVNTPRGQEQVNYRGIYPGTLMGSDYYIVGGITSIDYNIFSGGAQLSISGIGGGRREYRLLVGVDLRLVNSRTGAIKSVASFAKEMVGVEVEAGIFRFFGDVLVDLNAGTKINEPLSLGVRAIMERAVFNMLSDLYDLQPTECQEVVRKADATARAAVAEAGPETGSVPVASLGAVR